jgi:CheY-like chemotaxis protein
MAANILVVEDDPLNRYLICDLLSNEGYQIVEASDGAEALELFCAQRFDLVITDFVMPKLNGLKFIQYLRFLRPKIPVIFMTGHLSNNIDEKILQELAEILPKPFKLDVLRSTVQRLLRDSAPC